MNTVNRQGMTLIEILIALALMATAMTVVVEFLGSSQDLSSYQVAEDEVNRDVSRVMRTISSDLAQSGWYSPGSVTLPVTWATDRTARYWPYVLWQNSTGGNSTGYSFATRSASLVSIKMPADRIPGVLETDSNPSHVGAVFGIANRPAYLTSYYAPSQELMFLKQITDNKWDAKLTNRYSQPQLSFPQGDWTDTSTANRAALGVLYPSVWKEGPVPDTWVGREFDANHDGVVSAGEGLDGSGKPIASYGVPMMAAELNAADTSSFRFQTAWETITQPDYDASVVKDVNLREYMYAVLPGRGGMGRLVRAYKVDLAAITPSTATLGDPGSIISSDATNTYGMRVEEILSENVVRAVFDTARTDQTLSLNQIRARIFFLRRSEKNPDLYARQILDVVFAMRARNTGIDRASDRKIFIDAGRFDPAL